MKRYLFITFALLTCVGAEAQTLRVSDDISLVKLADKVYQHISLTEMPPWGRFPANGILLIDGAEAFLFDTPWDDAQTEALYEWLADSMQVQLTAVVPNHWHEDCMGGLAFLHSKGVRSYANQMTIEIAREKGLPVPQEGFEEWLTLDLHGIEVICYYPGAGHATDNIVVWIPSEKVLFAGCLVKDAGAVNLGNTADGDIAAWPATLQNVLEAFPNAEIVVPGHGAAGGKELIGHTLKLLTGK